ncbi:hypothetical protein OG921_04840 [Aldersonia sp. NBC_00410]|uniref:hypothetical protein n=1 Tax=Aldersonia sp. NBC_00410 TaxID=2975954 RepID=UPI0022587627|nr:hypothetical protein [Aldersonia sp. NBC_00410]MCX5042498.1 hypothetical protein [Aldersonia sp. NBC_00410]
MVKVLDDPKRAAYRARTHQPGPRGAWARWKLHIDDNRRRNAAAAERAAIDTTEAPAGRKLLRLTSHGYRGRGGGATRTVGRVPEYRATTVQAPGLWPWAVGAGSPLVGTPIGPRLGTPNARTVCMDLLNWLTNGFITAPVGFVLALNGFGKSTFVRRQVLGTVAQGVTNLILADVRPDYRALVEALGGQVVDLGYGYGRVNPLAGGVLGSIIPLLSGDLQRRMRQELRGRQVETVSALLELIRGRRIEDYEETIIATGLHLLYTEKGFTPERPPLLSDMLALVDEGHPELIADAGEDDTIGYRTATKNLRRSLRALIRGRFGEIFNGHTTTEIDIDAIAVCIDVSHIPQGDKKLKAAVMLVCWADGFAAIEAAHALTDAGLAPQRLFQAVMDEMWDVLGLGPFMTDRVNAVTRLNRRDATALWMILHSLADLEAVESRADVNKAMGFFERARVKVIGPVPEKEIDRLDKLCPFTATERAMVTRWSDPPPLIDDPKRAGDPERVAAGVGKFLIKYGEGGRPGIPVQVLLTPAERDAEVHATNKRFDDFGIAGGGAAKVGTEVDEAHHHNGAQVTL